MATTARQSLIEPFDNEGHPIDHLIISGVLLSYVKHSWKTRNPEYNENGARLRYHYHELVFAGSDGSRALGYRLPPGFCVDVLQNQVMECLYCEAIALEMPFEDLELHIRGITNVAWQQKVVCSLDAIRTISSTKPAKK